jgi:hypothetical protein
LDMRHVVVSKHNIVGISSGTSSSMIEKNKNTV